MNPKFFKMAVVVEVHHPGWDVLVRSDPQCHLPDVHLMCWHQYPEKHNIVHTAPVAALATP